MMTSCGRTSIGPGRRPLTARLLLPGFALMAAAAAAAAAVLLPAAAGATDCLDEGDPAFGTHACKVARLRSRPFVVVAVPENGINPYHVDFRLPVDDDRIGVHPSEYIEGFPAAAPTLNLSFDAGTPAEGYARDAAEWDKLVDGEPAWVGGTNIIGRDPEGLGRLLRHG